MECVMVELPICSCSWGSLKVSKREAGLIPSSSKSEELASQILLEVEVFGRGGGMGRHFRQQINLVQVRRCKTVTSPL